MIPTRLDNPNGFHQKYFIQKIVKANGMFDDGESNLKLAPVDEGAEYFVMRLDEGGGDPVHISACRQAVLRYAELIEDHLPQLAKDLRDRYSSYANYFGPNPMPPIS